MSIGSRIKAKFTDPKEADAVVNALFVAAKAGDVQAARLLASYDSGVPIPQKGDEGTDAPPPTVVLEEGKEAPADD